MTMSSLAITRFGNASHNGAILYRGPSRIDGQEIVVIVTGLKSGSTNQKT